MFTPKSLQTENTILKKLISPTQSMSSKLSNSNLIPILITLFRIDLSLLKLFQIRMGLVELTASTEHSELQAKWILRILRLKVARTPLSLPSITLKN